MNTTTGERLSPIKGYSNYLVSDQGKVYNKKRNSELYPRLNNGYYRVTLCEKGVCREFQVARLVAEAFLPAFQKNWHVQHRNGDHSDNRAENLKYRVQGKKIRIVETGDVFPSIKAAAAHIHGDDKSVGEVLKGKRKHHKGFTFEYYDK